MKRIKPQRAGSPDEFNTPDNALGPLLRHIPKDWCIWEPATGKMGEMQSLVNGLQKRGYKVLTTCGQFSIFNPPSDEFDCIVTNPPYSIKDRFLDICYTYDKPFALLMPLTALEGKARQRLYRRFGIQLILLDSRINFIEGGSGAWFPVAWFTHGLNLNRDLIFETVNL